MLDVRRHGDEAGVMKPDGLRHGDRIPGSNYFRAFCEDCREPMRVIDPEWICRCETCSGAKSHQARSQAMLRDRRLIYLPEHRKE